MPFVSELKRRNVIRVGAAWLALSWLLVAMCALLFPALGLPATVLPWIILGLVLALPLLLIVAWRYELTRQGLQRHPPTKVNDPTTTPLSRRLDQLVIVLILAALSLSLLRQFIDEVGTQSAPATSSQTPPPETRPPTTTADPRSLAVLPFANLSPNSEDAYFAEGLAEELLDILAGIAGLKVTSRTSSFVFRDQSLDTREIASRLGVAHLLEGSVRRDGKNVRIRAQLVDARNDETLWSQSYDRQLVDIFQLQEEIAQAIADAMANSLGVRQVEVTAATDNLQAYEAYLRGRQLFAQRGASLPAARELLQLAVDSDPQFADAWAALAGTWYVWSYYAADSDGVDTLAQAQTTADRALAIDPQHPGALAVSARVAAENGNRLKHAELIAQAIALEPNNANTWLWQGLGLFEVGHIQKAHDSFVQAQRLDPLSGLQTGWLGITTTLLGDWPAGIGMLRQSRDLGWRGPASRALFLLPLGSAGEGDVKEAYLQWLRDDDSMPPEQRQLAMSIAGALENGADLEQAQQRLLAAASDEPGAGWATLLQVFGLSDAALQQSLSSNPAQAQSPMLSQWYPSFRSYLQHPSFIQLADQYGLSDYWQQHGPPDGCVLTEQPLPHLECEQ
ncbi:MAG: hypothetical protein DHS20C11_08540 [Lysobacteraceae bacterium]|nr:MAG: hypothetical protein DHS20C11_08540 [Xanthomonadaceae bacterium]